MKVLIAGGSGQLARAYIERLGREGVVCDAPAEADFDITDPSSIKRAFDAARPDVLINCAAYNLVDMAESKRELVLKINAEGPGLLAREAQGRGAAFVHFSSDYVFDGRKMDGLYTEGDVPGPLNVYGESKLRSERIVLAECERSLVFRLSWVYGEGVQNFVHKFLDWAEGKAHMPVACDEFSVPTLTHTVVDVSLRAIGEGMTGLHHLTNSGYCSRYEWAREMFRILGIRTFLRPVGMATFNSTAMRPGFSAMDNAGISKLLGMEIPHWTESLERFLSARRTK